jgi:hypothetical protein
MHVVDCRSNMSGVVELTQWGMWSFFPDSPSFWLDLGVVIDLEGRLS